jgi:hypothetical protein
MCASRLTFCRNATYKLRGVSGFKFFLCIPWVLMIFQGTYQDLAITIEGAIPDLLEDEDQDVRAVPALLINEFPEQCKVSFLVLMPLLISSLLRISLQP